MTRDSAPHLLQCHCYGDPEVWLPGLRPGGHDVEADFEVRDPGEVRERVGEGVAAAEAEGEGVDGVEEGVGFVVEGAAGEEERW